MLKRSLEWLWWEYEGFLTKALKERGLQGKDLADAVGDARLIIGKKHSQFRGNSLGELTLWVKRIAGTVSRQYRLIYFREESLEDCSYEPPLEFSNNVESTAVMRVDLEKVLEQLPARRAEALILRDGEGYSWEKVGEFLSCPVERAKKLVYEARRAMRVRLTLHGLVVVAIHLNPSCPNSQDRVEVWVELDNSGYGNASDVRVCVHVGKDNLGQQTLNISVGKRGKAYFSDWTARRGNHVIKVILKMDKMAKEFQKGFVVK